MVDLELALQDLEEELEYHAARNRELEDELNGLLQDSRKEMLGANEGLESLETQARIFEREELIAEVWDEIKISLESFIWALEELAPHRRREREMRNEKVWCATFRLVEALKQSEGLNHDG